MNEAFSPIAIIFIILVCAAIIFLIRLFGAWLLRIDEIIKNQKSILEELKKANKQKGVE